MSATEPNRRTGLALLRVDEQGATAVEYALLAALIAVVIAGIVGMFGQEVVDLFTTVEGAF